MQIAPEILSEKNYTGSRLIEITDPKVIELKAKLKEYQEEANPFLVEMDKIAPELDVFFQKIQKLEEEKNKLREEMSPVRAPYDELLKKVEAIDSKAQVIKNKIQPIVNKLVEGQLGEFEKALHLTEQDGKIFVEVVDEIEERVKAIRQAKIKK
jgi:chromosome segregation ATPase